MLGGKRRVIISYWSRVVPKHQPKYGAIKLEFLCLYGVLQNWKLLLTDAKVTVISFCKALLNIYTIFSRGIVFMHTAETSGSFSGF